MLDPLPTKQLLDGIRHAAYGALAP
jgi:hypothetical protein